MNNAKTRNTSGPGFTEAEYNALPEWAKAICEEYERTRYSAMIYRREAVSIRRALHDKLCDCPTGFALHDCVIALAKSYTEKLDKLDDGQKMKNIRNEVRARIVAEAKKMSGDVKDKNARR